MIVLKPLKSIDVNTIGCVSGSSSSSCGGSISRGSRSIVVGHWTAGQHLVINPAPGAYFIPKFKSLVQVVPGPV